MDRSQLPTASLGKDEKRVSRPMGKCQYFHCHTHYHRGFSGLYAQFRIRTVLKEL